MERLLSFVLDSLQSTGSRFTSAARLLGVGGQRSRRQRLWALGAVVLVPVLGFGVFGRGDAHAQVNPLQINALAQGVSSSKKALLLVNGPSTVLQTQLVFQAGAQTGWHLHPGPVVVVVNTGTLTEIQSDGCTIVHPAGSVFFEEAGVVHNAVNQTGGVTELYATFLSPTGAQPLIQVPDPGAVCSSQKGGN